MLACNCGAVSYYLQKRAIDGEVKCCSLPDAGKPSRNVQLVKVEDASFFRATPWEYVLVDRPWKNPIAVSAQKICGGERST